MNNQIDSSSNVGMMSAPLSSLNADQQKLQMQEEVMEFMDKTELKKRMKQLKDCGTRLNVDIDEVRSFSRRLSQFITKNPIEAIRMFEDQLNQEIRGMEQEDKSEKVAAQNTAVNFPKKV